MPKTVQKLINRLTLRQLQVFEAVYRERGYGRAAELLGLTQPAVSAQVKHLEDALGLKLFEFVGRKLYCTAAGEMVAERVEQMFEQIRALQNGILTMEGQVAGDLRIAAVNTCQYVVPYLLRQFIAEHPSVNGRVHVGNRANVIERLAENSDDLVIMNIVPSDRALSSLPFLDNEFVPLVAAGHPLLSEEKVTPAQFMAEPLLVRERGSGSRLMLEQYCQQQRLKLEPAMELGSSEAIKHALLAGMGVAVLPRFSVMAELKLGLMHKLPVAGFPLRRTMCLVYPSNKVLSLAATRFLEFVQQHLAEISDYFQGFWLK
ncbi:LysR family transcriptional regulator [Halioxenophilus sp. WMMB6]|uniref:LysR family transcriptional regulator n=1 Tax=Halioxenophilus sp. WMMB6 TaxID=3073815 RepID=UPI00295ED737|nr:LysR family transcriptional regulator [Halioxenophilus sp. WMMB6]